DFALVRQRSAIGLQSAGKAKPVARDLPKCPFCVSRDSPVWISILPTCPFLGSHRHSGLFNRTRFIKFHPYCRLVHDGRGTQEHGARSAFFCKVVQVTTSRLMQRAILMTSHCQWAGSVLNMQSLLSGGSTWIIHSSSYVSFSCSEGPAESNWIAPPTHNRNHNITWPCTSSRESSSRTPPVGRLCCRSTYQAQACRQNH